MKILITGASGLLGHNAALAMRDKHNTLGTYLNGPRPTTGEAAHIDLTARHALADLFARYRPDAVVHAAAMSNAGQCEKEPDLARKINVDATRHLAQLCEKTGARMLHISTDLVFDGRKGDYAEDDEPAPISRYGEGKLAAEREVRAVLENHVVLRIALMYGRSPSGTRGADEAIIAANRAGRTVQMFTDEYRTPVDAATVAEVLEGLVESELTGLYHCGGGERLSRYDFAEKLARVADLDTRLIKPARIAEMPTIPPRAPDVSLNSTKLQKALAITLPDVATGLSSLHATK